MALKLLLKYILELILIFWLLRLLLRLAAPFLFRTMAKKAGEQAERFYRQQQQQYTNTYNQRQGEMHVNYAPEQQNKRKPNLDSAGEFVDYEEVK
ncbi:DUF4834 family protein [Solitalea lacus]|uniref:DUF4834 family protein n=1 Tax=Solitalea lacus TaxID=2911172 RepID=UPI001EDC594F|nr:DUF4834 family protein [Solitalea lacus]UKJ08092.1 DUF4834 family protein [Solitalea lacus]